MNNREEYLKADAEWRELYRKRRKLWEELQKINERMNELDKKYFKIKN